MLTAFTYMFKDSKYLKIASIYIFLILLANILFKFAQIINIPGIPFLLFITGHLILFIPTGYIINCIKALMTQKENKILPGYNLKNNFIKGFKFFIASMLVGLIFGMLIIPLMIIVMTLPVSSYKNIFTGNIIVIGLMLVILAFFILYLIYGLSMCTIFAKKEYITSFFRFETATKLITNCPKKYFKALGIYILVTILFTIINYIPAILLKIYDNIFVGIIFLVIPSIISGYTTFVCAYLVAHSTNHEILEEIEE